MGEKSKKKSIITAICLSLFCFILLASLLPYLVTSARVEKYITLKLSSFLQTKTSLQNISLSLWPPIGIKVAGLEIKDIGPGEENLIQLEDLSLKVSPLPLLWGQVSLKEVKLKGLTLNIKRNSQGETNLARLLMVNERTSPKRWYLPFSLKIKNLIIEHGQIIVRDEALTSAPFTFALSDVGISIRGVSFDRPFPFQLEAQLPDSIRPAKIALQGKIIPPPNHQSWSKYRIDSTIQISSLPLAQFTPILASKRLGGWIDITGNYSGEITGPFSSSFQVKFLSLDLDDPRLFQQPIYLPEGQLSFKLDNVDKRLALEDILLTTGVYSLKGFCRLENQELHAQFNSASPLLLTSIKDHLPQQIFPGPIYKYIQKRMLRGQIDNFSLEIKGGLREITNKELIAKKNLIMAQTRLSEVELTFDDHFHSVEEVKGLVSFRQGKLIFSDLQGRYKGSGLLRGSGQIDHLLGLPVLSLSIEGPIRVEDLGADFAADKSAPHLLYTLGREGNFKGPAGLELKISRVLQDKQPLLLTGRLGLRNNSISYAPLKLPLIQLQGSVEFTREMVQTETLQGKWGQSPFLLKGIMKGYRGRNPSLKLQVSTELDLSDLKSRLSYPFLDALTYYEGTPSLQVNIQNPDNQWQIAGTLDLTNTGYQYKGIKKDSGVLNLLSCDLQPDPGEGWRIDKFGLELGDIVASGQGRIVNQDWQLELETNKFDINQMLSFLQEDAQHQGKNWVQGTLGLKGTWQSASPPNIKFNLTVDQIDLDKLFSNSGDKNNEFLRNNLLQGSITAKGGRFLGLSFSQLKADMLAPKPGVMAGDLELKLHQGYFKGKTSIQIDSSQGPGYYLAGSGRKIKIEGLIQELNHGHSVLSGSLGLTLKLETQGRTAEARKASLNGKVSIRVKNGVLKRYSLISKIFSFLNVSQLLELKLPDLVAKGIPYKEIGGDFQIKNGIAQTDNLFLASRSLNMAAIGQIDLTRKSLNLTIAVQPLQTVDKIVALVPILGHILTDEKKSLILAFFNAKGPWNDPSVTPIPFASLRKGILGIFKRIFLLPKDVVKEPWEVLLPKLP